MGTRSTQTVSRAVAERAIERALKAGKLSNEAISAMLEAVADETSGYGAHNFTITQEPGEDDQYWMATRTRT